MKVKIVNRPSGLLNGRDWPAVGAVVDLPDVVAESMAASGDVELVKAEKVEKRPASTEGVETRKAAKKAAPAKPKP